MRSAGAVSTPRPGRSLRLSAAALASALGIALASGCGGDSGGGSQGPTPLEQHLYLAPTAVPTALSFDRVGVYNRDAAERHYERLFALFDRTLRRAGN